MSFFSLSWFSSIMPKRKKKTKNLQKPMVVIGNPSIYSLAELQATWWYKRANHSPSHLRVEGHLGSLGIFFWSENSQGFETKSWGFEQRWRNFDSNIWDWSICTNKTKIQDAVASFLPICAPSNLCHRNILPSKPTQHHHSIIHHPRLIYLYSLLLAWHCSTHSPTLHLGPPKAQR